MGQVIVSGVLQVIASFLGLWVVVLLVASALSAMVLGHIFSMSAAEKGKFADPRRLLVVGIINR